MVMYGRNGFSAYDSFVLLEKFFVENRNFSCFSPRNFKITVRVFFSFNIRGRVQTKLPQRCFHLSDDYGLIHAIFQCHRGFSKYKMTYIPFPISKPYAFFHFHCTVMLITTEKRTMEMLKHF